MVNIFRKKGELYRRPLRPTAAVPEYAESSRAAEREGAEPTRSDWPPLHDADQAQSGHSHLKQSHMPGDEELVHPSQHHGVWEDEDKSNGGESDLPQFRYTPSELSLWRESRRERGAGADHAALWEAFTPTQPKRWSRLFAGRRWAVQRIIQAIEEEQAHVLIYGLRGIGKTSLANVIAESAGKVEYHVLRCPCSSDITFEEIFRGFLRSLPSDYMERTTRAENPEIEHFEQLLPRGDFGATELSEAVSYLKLQHVILIIDEFDRVTDESLKNQLAETIKNLSDTGARITLIIVGIANSLDELIGKHPSIQRNLVGVHLPLMDRDEILSLIHIGEQASGITFEEAATERIAAFAKGLPYYAQLMCLHAGRAALSNGSTLVGIEDLKHAFTMVMDEADPRIIGLYERAVQGEQRSFMINVLFAAACARYDRFGAFAAADAAKVAVDKSGRRIQELHLHKALSGLALQRGDPMLEKVVTPAGKTIYRFIHETMRQYILIRQARDRGLI